MVKKLTIPCVVTSVGLRSTYEPDFSVPFDFDNDVKEFVSAVLEKSSIIGVRGEITGKYLSRLGFKEDTDYMVTGCPSMYTNGSSLPIRPLNLTKDSRICLNSSVTTPNNIHDFLYRTAQEIPDWHFVPQVRSELQILYSGIPYKVKANPHYPRKISDKAYCDERSKFFLNAPTWFDYLAEADLAIGSRLHGNIAALIAGTPALLFPKDARVRELADYHKLTSVPANQVTEDTSVWELVESVDFQSPCSVQKETFDRFISFLDKNEIPHIYSNDAEPSVIPFEERMKQVKLQPPVTTAALCSPEELAARWAAYNSIKDSTILRLREKNAALTRELNAQKAASGSTLSLFQKGIKYVRKHL
jgi:hypothetical protein